MKLIDKNGVILLLLIPYCHAIRTFHEENEVPAEELVESQTPEEQQVSEDDIYTYSGLVVDGEKIGDIKQAVEEMSKPKPLDDDMATAVYQEKLTS